MIDLAGLRAYALARTLPEPAPLEQVIRRLGFVQADPIRAPARAQDLTLRHRVTNYRAGDLERAYPSLAVEEDCLVNYGFLPREHLALLHPRVATRRGSPALPKREEKVLDFVRQRGSVHPRDVAERFAHGRVTNAWGGTSSATTRLLDAMHYRGLLRVARRDNGIRIYSVQQHAVRADDVLSRSAQADALVDLVVAKYAPLPGPSLAGLVRMLQYAAPQLSRQWPAALLRAKGRLAHGRVDGVEWYWPADEDPRAFSAQETPRVRLLAPFDPVVWDRRRFEAFWGWAYRFEAYVPAEKRKLGYYALPLLWCDQVVGWGNVSKERETLRCEFGYAARKPPRDPRFRRELADEVERMRAFLGP